ncbi:pilus assembly protein PilW [Vibrio cholerae]|uniref:PilW family protein n=1 Tax=Vibrio cholerae TaxID=666 RepID=UPI000F419A5C|nr:prepilin-type N-terminal cleavage/methylation domain-containing protein [Vibrio cholerae]NOE86775.1 pilus assembly protein PilW [Vibrio cholerae]NOE95784.1 pilus assembly protein PilW [Vibrio cholerae]NOF00738.1 pilus assembly protein PilW [Vibrio cholerae]NOF12597.1 pilus assembly protein PilW [Vibrio cholerae]NOF15893.1 pilus assembly protein PilW [Vibrio cholerae]
MVMNSANKQKGNTLIEFMIASLVGAMALAIIGAVFLSNQKAATQRSKEIMLLQQMSSVMQQMKEDIQRAGFDGMGTKSLRLSGATGIIYQQPDRLGYVYRQSAAVSASSTVYKFDGMLKYCQKDSASPQTIVAAASGCSDLFDPNQIEVTQFGIAQSQLFGASVESAFISISMAAKLKNDPSIYHTMSLQVQQRNWQ